MKTYLLENLDCAGCAREIETMLNEREDVELAVVDFAERTLSLDSRDHVAALEAIAREHAPVVAKVAPPARLSGEGARTPRRDVAELVASIALLLLGLAFSSPLPAMTGLAGSLPAILAAACSATAWIVAGYRVAMAGAKSLLSGFALDENFLMTIASIGAFALGEWAEGAAVMVFYKIGSILEERALRSSRASFRALLELKPATARLVRGGMELEVPADALRKGDIARVRPGERVPVDGVVASGSGSVDASSLTGESEPRPVAPGDALSSGFLSLDAAFDVEATALASESAAARIAAMVERAATSKTRAEGFVTAFAKRYTPAVVLGALALAFLPPLLLPGQDLGEWVRRALTLLVISCPCALVVSVPLAYFGGIGGAARKGALVKNASVLDALAKADVVVFDKTGTLTDGKPEIVRLEPAPGADAESLLGTAALAEARSNHPIAAALRNAWTARAGAEATAALAAIADDADAAFLERGGYGVVATSQGRRLLAGTRRLLESEGVTLPEGAPVRDATGARADDASASEAERDAGTTLVLVAAQGRYLGAIRLADAIKPDAARAVAELGSLGVRSVLMMTGDTDASARRVADAVGIRRFEAGLLPEDKMASLERELAGGSVVFVGDGVNDAPAIARADVGVAMGSGAELARESADVVATSSSPALVPEALRGARKTRHIVVENVVFSLAVKASFLALGAAGMAGMWEAVIADVGVTLLAVLNSLRALR